ncbi:transporter [Paramyrothecium foliicola]|nr:transporter [Paramyrothecium foliicola]
MDDDQAQIRLQKRRRQERGPRSKQGCKTCVGKKVKCDEQHPLCGRCIRLRLTCVWGPAKPSLALRRRGLGPIKDRCSWEPKDILPKESGSAAQHLDGASVLRQSTPVILEDVSLGDELDATNFALIPAESAPIDDVVLLPADIIGAWRPVPFSVHPDTLNLDYNILTTSPQSMLCPFQPMDFLSSPTSLSFMNLFKPAPSIGCDDSQALDFHRTIFAPLKSTRIVALSAHTLFLDLAAHNRATLHFLLAFSYSELAIHQGFSHCPPVESHRHFQQGSWLFSQVLGSSNHVAAMISFLYLYMFWMRRDPLDIVKLRDLGTFILVYVRSFGLDDLCAGSAPEGSTTSDPVLISRILTYIYDRDVFCGFFGSGGVFASFVSENHEKRRRIWQLSRSPFSTLDDHNVYFTLITIQHEINCYSQSSEEHISGAEGEIQRKLHQIRKDHRFLFELATDCHEKSSPLMALVTVTFFHALEIYLYRSRGSSLGELPTPARVQLSLKELMTTAYYATAAGPVQLLERFQWALLIAGIETHDPSAKQSCEMGDENELGTSDSLSSEEEKKLVRKIDMRLMPLLIVSYGLQYLDKTSLAYSAILGLREDLNLVGQQFSWASSIFYIGYLVASYPISLGFVRFPLGKYLSILMFIWGVILTLHAVAANYPSLMVLRTLLGVFESAISPGFSLITGMWYTPHEHVSRHSFWFAGNASASIVGAMIAYGILKYDGPLAPWKMLFLIFGLITIAWSVLMFFYLPDSPANAKFLTRSEREFAALRPKKFQKTTQTRKWDRNQFIEAMKDGKSWWFFFFSFVICVPNGGTTSFSTIVIKSFGYDEFQTILMGLPASAFQLTTVILAAVGTTYIRKSRLVALVLIYFMAIAGILMIKLLPVSEKLARLAGFWLIMAVAPAFPLMLSLSSSNIAGFTKKSTVMAMIFLGYCAGNLAGPQFFIAIEAPSYHTAYTTILVCFAITIVLVVALRFYLSWENGRRDKEQGVFVNPEEIRHVDLSTDGALLQVDETDIQNRSFRYII